MHFLCSLLYHFRLFQVVLTTEIETSCISILWPGIITSELREHCVWPIRNWLDFQLTLSCCGQSKMYINIAKKNTEVLGSFVTLISSIAPSDFQLCPIFHLCTEKWVFQLWTWEMQKTQRARLEGGSLPQKITAVAMNASENTAVGEHKSTVPNVSLWYAWC